MHALQLIFKSQLGCWVSIFWEAKARPLSDRARKKNSFLKAREDLEAGEGELKARFALKPIISILIRVGDS